MSDQRKLKSLCLSLQEENSRLSSDVADFQRLLSASGMTFGDCLNHSIGLARAYQRLCFSKSDNYFGSVAGEMTVARARFGSVAGKMTVAKLKYLIDEFDLRPDSHHLEEILTRLIRALREDDHKLKDLEASAEYLFHDKHIRFPPKNQREKFGRLFYVLPADVALLALGTPLGDLSMSSSSHKCLAICQKFGIYFNK